MKKDDHLHLGSRRIEEHARAADIVNRAKAASPVGTAGTDRLDTLKTGRDTL